MIPVAEPHEFRIWLDDREHEYVVVDEEDYCWAVRWRWQQKFSRGNATWYAVRTLSTSTNGFREDVCLYLHVEIMKRTKIEKPSHLHTLVDHFDRDVRNCQRYNLRWATPSMNRLNSNWRRGK